MNDHVYKITELAGTSPDSIEQAVKNAIEKAANSIRNMRWLQVIETRAHIENQKISHWQVVIKVGFTVED
jgi:flavin-binding protein dodecin